MEDRQLAIRRQEGQLTSNKSDRNEIEPLSRLVVRDGLLLNAERWQQAHQYHRQRQNLHYQSLHRGGIVLGLGVKTIAPPNRVPAQYRQEKRWLRIQPGMAIDNYGNPIIVTEAIDLRLTAYPQSAVVYLVIRYVDPDNLELVRETELVREMFRIEEKLTPPEPQEIELCRIELRGEVLELSNPQNPLFPQPNQIDLRDRPTATNKPHKSVRVAQLAADNPPDFNWQYLSQSIEALYPQMCCDRVLEIDLAEDSNAIAEWDLLWLTQQQLHSLSPVALERLNKCLALGCTVTIEISSQETAIAELSAIEQQLQSALVDAKSLTEFPEIPQQIETELQACEAKLTEKVREITTAIANVFPQLQPKPQRRSQEGISLAKDLDEITEQVTELTAEIDRLTQANSGAIAHNHPLRNQPFLFARFPTINEQQIEVLNWGGIILVIGDLSAAWGLNSSLNLSRESIRTAQELGINILHFAWQKRHLTKLIQ